MRALPSLVVLVSVLVLGSSATVERSAADPVRTIWRLAPQDAGTGGASGQSPPLTPPAPSVEPLLGDVSGPAREVSLPDVLALAVRTLPALEQARIDRQIAEEAVIRAETWGDWNVDANLAVTGGRRIGVDHTVTVSLEGDVAKRLSNGGTIALHAGTGYGRTAFDGAADDDTGFREELSASYIQPLRRGRGEDFVRAAERIARHQLDAVALAEQQVAIDAVNDVVLAYIDLVAAENNLAIQRSSLDLARERLRVTEAGIRAGGVAESEIISVEQAIATREEAVMTAELGVIDRSLALRRLIGMEIAPGQIALASRIDLAVPQRSWDARSLIEQTLAASPELARLTSTDAAAQLEIEVTEHGVMPQLDLALSLGVAGTDDNPGSAAVEMVKAQELTATAGLTYRTTWGERAARAEVRQARLRRQKIRVTGEDIRRQLSSAVASAVAQVQASERRFAIAARAVTLAEKNLQVEQARLELGRSRNVDVLIRQDELRAAQLRASQAVLDWHRAATVIGALTAEILPTYGIEVSRTGTGSGRSGGVGTPGSGTAPSGGAGPGSGTTPPSGG